MKQWFVTVIVACLAVAPAWGQEAEVDRAEVLRLGNMVQHVDGVRSDPEALFVEAMGPPASDADKWFISVLTTQGCIPCVKLKNDWANSAWLLALADPNDPKKSWAHYNVYAHEDQSQAFRFEKLQVEAYPTVIVQPPRSKRYGDPKTVVFQGTYGGDPEQLARQITAAIKQYVAKFERSQPPQPPVQHAAEGTGGIDPPWQPPPKLDVPLPDFLPAFPQRRPLVPPNLSPTDLLVPKVFRWGTTGTVMVTVVLTLLAVWGVPRALQAIRTFLSENRRQSGLSQEQFQQLLQAMRTGGTATPTDKSGTPSP